MASSTLDAVRSGASVFIDATIFVYHFAGASSECRTFLTRCARGDVTGFTSVVVLAEVTHRLMMAEAAARGLVTGPNLARKLRDRPEIVQHLVSYSTQVERMLSMGLQILALDLPQFLEARAVRQRYGLLTNDSLVAAAALQNGFDALATADRDFERVTELRLFRPGDLVP